MVEQMVKMVEQINSVKRELWAPLDPVLEQIADTIAAAPLEAQLEYQLLDAPNLWRNFHALFKQRHPAVFAAYEAAYFARNRAANAAAAEKAKQLGIAKRKATLVAKKAAREANQPAAQ